MRIIPMALMVLLMLSLFIWGLTMIKVDMPTPWAILVGLVLAGAAAGWAARFD